MSDYIKREDAIKNIKALKKMPFEINVFEGAVYDIPATDVVEVVRCKDCKLAETVNCPMYKAHFGYTDEDYCSCGKPKE